MKLRGAAKARFLARMARGRRNKTRKVNKPRFRRVSVARRRRFSRRGRTIIRRVGRSRGRIIGAGSWLAPIAAGIGTARIAEQIFGRVAPQFTSIASLGAAYLGGRFKGLVGELGYEVLTGRSGILSSFGIGQPAMSMVSSDSAL